MTTRDETMPQGVWQFDESVTQVFADMLERSIPDYGRMRELTLALAGQIIDQHNHSRVVDLGCSTGLGLSGFVGRFGVTRRYTGCDTSEPMLQAARERFHGWDSIVEIKLCDLRRDYPVSKGVCDSSAVLSVLTLMFIPIERRLALLKRIYDSLLPGGIFVLVEKLVGEGATLDQLFQQQYLILKGENGYSQEQILRKQLSLEHVMTPLPATWTIEMLRLAGFRELDCFWRAGCFGGFLALK